MAITATFASNGFLSIFGDANKNSVFVSRDAAGNILVNGGAVHIQGGRATVANTAKIQMFGQDGNDTLTIDETNGAMPAALMFGGGGNDTMTGGSGNDMLFGEVGDDILLGGIAMDAMKEFPVLAEAFCAEGVGQCLERFGLEQAGISDDERLVTAHLQQSRGQFGNSARSKQSGRGK